MLTIETRTQNYHVETQIGNTVQHTRFFDAFDDAFYFVRLSINNIWSNFTTINPPRSYFDLFCAPPTQKIDDSFFHHFFDNANHNFILSPYNDPSTIHHEDFVIYLDASIAINAKISNELYFFYQRNGSVKFTAKGNETEKSDIRYIASTYGYLLNQEGMINKKISYTTMAKMILKNYTGHYPHLLAKLLITTAARYK